MQFFLVLEVLRISVFVDFSSRKEMGCASSKVLARRSWRFRDDVERSLKGRPAKGLEELVSYKNGGEHLFALLSSVNPSEEHEKNPTTPVESNVAGLEEEDEEKEYEKKSEVGSKRKAMAKELSVLEVPPFEFAKGGQEPYVTPKFGKFYAPKTKHGDEREDEGAVFDPELVAQFERAMNELAIDEEFVLRQITNGLE